ncbi:hypothetical protein [Streptomyces sp. NPDC060002]|uniref:hypothetical protein n=1 Tax=Streptomyces sp. NPDC060002 TaxID=3347033 RepID=UPI0036A8AE61
MLTVAGGAAAAVRSGSLSFGSSCRDHPVRLPVAASPDVVPALTAAAKQAKDSVLTSDGQCLAVGVTARESSEVAETPAAGEDRTRRCGWRTRTSGSSGSPPTARRPG